MSSLLRIADLPNASFYAPDYKVRVEGEELDAETKGYITQLKVVMDQENLSSFEATFGNPPTEQGFLYSDSGLVDIGKRVQIEMGYADELRSMLVGQITTIKPSFPQTGHPTVTVTGLDGLVRLRDKKPGPDQQTVFEDMADWEIVQVVADRNGLDFDPAAARANARQHAVVDQKNQDEAQFLTERARRIDFDVYILTDPDSGDDTLHFEPPTDGRDAGRVRAYELEWGKSLIEFSPKLTLSSQVATVTVRGWDPTRKARIEVTVGAKDLADSGDGGTSGPAAAEQHLGGKGTEVIDTTVTSEEDARDLAKSLLSERAYEFITGTGKLVGWPEIRPGDNLDMIGIGARFSGRYYVKKATHVIGSTGYLTDFEVRKVYDPGASA